MARRDVRLHPALSDRDKEESFIGRTGALIIVLGAVAIYFFVTARPDPKPVTGAPVAVLVDSVQCDRLVEVARRDGIVRGDVVGGRLFVRPAAWARLDKGRRHQLIEYATCAAYSGRPLESLLPEEALVVQAAGSGKVLAVGTRSGVDYR